MALVSGVALVGLVIAVAQRQPPAIAAPPGLVAAAACATARRQLGPAASGPPISDRSYAIAYPVLAHGVLAGLFAAYVVVHETSRTISGAAIHAAYWAAMGATWLLPVTVQAWHPGRPPEDPPP